MGVLCLNFIPMIRACSVTDSGFLECSCSVLGTSLVGFLRFLVQPHHTKLAPTKSVLLYYLKDLSQKVMLKSKLGTTASENKMMIVFQNGVGTLECLYGNCITGL